MTNRTTLTMPSNVSIPSNINTNSQDNSSKPEVSLAEELHQLNVKIGVESAVNAVTKKPEEQVQEKPKHVPLDSALQRIGFRARLDKIAKNLPADENGFITKDMFTTGFASLRRVPFEHYDAHFNNIVPGMPDITDDFFIKDSLFRGKLGEYAEEVMRLADANGDGKLTRDELINFMLDRDKSLRGMFEAIDTNNNGFIEPEEFVAALHDAGLRLSSRDVVTLWERMSDPVAFGDSAIKTRRLTYQQFRHLLLLIPFQEPNLRSVFRTLDAFHLSVSDLDLLPLPAAHFEGLSVRDRRLYVLAGGLAGILGRTATAPFDRMRVYLQNETQEVFSGREARKGDLPKGTLRGTIVHFWHGVQILFRTRGLPEFWRGNFIECLRVFPATAAQFGMVEYVKGIFKVVEGTKTRSDISHHARFIAGAVGGMASVAVTFPLGTLKIRMMSAIEGESVAKDFNHTTPVSKPDATGKRAYSTMTRRGINFMDPHCFRGYVTMDPNPTSEYRAWPAAKALWRREGFRGFYRGLGISLAGMAPFAGINYTVFEGFKQNALSTMDITRVDPLRVFYYGLASASLATAICYPFQVIKTRMQAQGTMGHPEVYASTYDCFKSLLRNEGWHGLFKGLGVTFSRTLPAAVIMRVAFEENKRILGLP
jgi:solute carrier family 25 phosphate transporter 23/24/25/41